MGVWLFLTLLHCVYCVRLSWVKGWDVFGGKMDFDRSYVNYTVAPGAVTVDVHLEGAFMGKYSSGTMFFYKSPMPSVPPNTLVRLRPWRSGPDGVGWGGPHPTKRQKSTM